MITVKYTPKPFRNIQAPILPYIITEPFKGTLKGTLAPILPYIITEPFKGTLIKEPFKGTLIKEPFKGTLKGPWPL